MMMRILVNHELVDAITPGLRQSFPVIDGPQEAKGTVLTAAEATSTYVSDHKRRFVLVTTIGVAVMLALGVIGLFAGPGIAAVVEPVVVLGCVSLVLFVFFLFRSRMRSWNHRLARRTEGLPPAGTAVTVDGNGLTLDATTYAWSSLSIDQVELVPETVPVPVDETTKTIHVADRLSLRAGTNVLVLDRAMLRNGPALVEIAWRRLLEVAPEAVRCTMTGRGI
jgi:hypothetical protein